MPSINSMILLIFYLSYETLTRYYCKSFLQRPWPVLKIPNNIDSIRNSQAVRILYSVHAMHLFRHAGSCKNWSLPQKNDAFRNNLVRHLLFSKGKGPALLAVPLHGGTSSSPPGQLPRPEKPVRNPIAVWSDGETGTA